MTFDEFRTKFGLDLGGVNFYIGISQKARTILKKDLGLNQTHKAFFNNVLEAIGSSPSRKKTVLLSIEPKETGRPFEYVAEQEAWLTHIAQDLDDYQKRAVQEHGGNLSLIVRYASEMNDARKPGKNEWGRDPAGFIESYRFVREIFHKHADRVRFTFSPTVRADIDMKALTDYFPSRPGDPFPYVNLISCTWYVGEERDFAKAVKNMNRYFSDRKVRQLPFGFDEIGGKTGTGGNDTMLLKMLGEIEKIGDKVHGHDIHFEYATLFIDGADFGRDAKLAFLSGHQDSFV